MNIEPQGAELTTISAQKIAGYETVTSYFRNEYPEAYHLMNDAWEEMTEDRLWCLKQTAAAGLMALPVIEQNNKKMDYAFHAEILEACFSRY